MPAPGPTLLGRPGGADLGLLVVGVLGVSTSGPLMAACVAPALAIAFWRNALAAAVTWPLVLARRRDRAWAELAARRGQVLLAGLLLAGHFALWIPSLRLTSVASATAMVSTQPVWSAVIAKRAGQHVPATAWWGIALAMLGVFVLTGVDLSLDPPRVLGDVMGLVAAALAAGYVAVGARARQGLSTGLYTSSVYTVCAALLLVVVVLGRSQLVGYSTTTWVQILVLTLLAQLLGHTVFNRVLATTSPTVVSLAILFETPGAALLAAAFLQQVPPLAALPALVLLLAGLGLVVRGGAGPKDPGQHVEVDPLL